jgi:thiamine pyrophosphokinase
MQAVIFANGSIDDSEPLSGKYDLIIAADGGARHCRNLRINPDIVIGDLDSIESDELKSLQSKGAEIIRYPVKKDKTDLELALRLAVKRGADKIALFGAMGMRWDMSIANILLPAEPCLSDAIIRIINGLHEITMLKTGKQITFYGEKGDILSLIPVGGDALGITSGGLEYSLKNSSLQFGSTRGISNVLVENSATVKLEKGLLLCVHIRSRATI